MSRMAPVRYAGEILLCVTRLQRAGAASQLQARPAVLRARPAVLDMPGPSRRESLAAVWHWLHFSSGLCRTARAPTAASA